MSSKNKGTFIPLLGYAAQFMPNYHDKVEWLKINGSNLL
jgi:hypothetical protein